MKLALLIALTCLAAHGQEFAVASIKPSPPQGGPRIRVAMNGGPGTADPTTFTCRCSLSMLVIEAYGVKYYQVAGLNSRESEIYDVAARVQDGATKEQFRRMLQSLMVDRFHMSIHRDARQLQAYDLVVAKNGVKVKESVAETASTEAPVSNTSSPKLDQEDFPIIPTGRAGMISVKGRTRMQAINETMEQFAARISNQLDLPVIDATGLNGKYDFSLYWANDTTIDNPGPSLFTAVESQLGLKLSPKKMAVPIIVIDHIDAAPSAN